MNPRAIVVSDLMRSILTATIDSSLEELGLRQVGRDTADVFIHYHASPEQAFGVEHLNHTFHAAEAFTGSVESFPPREEREGWSAGTLLLDINDPDSGRLFWRGWAETGAAGDQHDEAGLRALLVDTVGRLTVEFPIRDR